MRRTRPGTVNYNIYGPGRFPDRRLHIKSTCRDEDVGNILTDAYINIILSTDTAGKNIYTESGYGLAIDPPLEDEGDYICADFPNDQIYRLALFEASSCEDVICGPNEHCNKGCCVCDAGFERDKYGNCVKIPYDNNLIPPPAPEPPPDILPSLGGTLLQENSGLILTENQFILFYDYEEKSNRRSVQRTAQSSY